MNNHIEEKFYKELVEMSPLKGRDMHNRPPLYDTPDEKIEEIKQFIKQALQSQKQSILEEIDRVIEQHIVKSQPLCEQNILLKLIKAKLLKH